MRADGTIEVALAEDRHDFMMTKHELSPGGAHRFRLVLPVEVCRHDEHLTEQDALDCGLLRYDTLGAVLSQVGDRLSAEVTRLLEHDEASKRD